MQAFFFFTMLYSINICTRICVQRLRRTVHDGGRCFFFWGGGAPIPTVIRTLQPALPKGLEGFHEKAHSEPKNLAKCVCTLVHGRNLKVKNFLRMISCMHYRSHTVTIYIEFDGAIVNFIYPPNFYFKSQIL